MPRADMKRSVKRVLGDAGRSKKLGAHLQLNHSLVSARLAGWRLWLGVALGIAADLKWGGGDDSRSSSIVPILGLGLGLGLADLCLEIVEHHLVEHSTLEPRLSKGE